MRRPAVLALVVPAVALAGCDGGAGDDPAGTDEAAIAPAMEVDEGDDGALPAADTPADGIAARTMVTLAHADGSPAGAVTFADEEGRVRVEAAVAGLEPGFHGFHLHGVPACDPEAAEGPFTSAGGHWTPASEPHGEHAGDLPPLLVAGDGTATASFVTDRFTLEEVADHGGVAVMVHADADNLANIPERYTSDEGDGPGADRTTTDAGDAGDRVACGVLEGAPDGDAG